MLIDYKSGDVLHQLETDEVFMIKNVLEQNHFYEGTNGLNYWDNFDPWCCKLVDQNTLSEKDLERFKSGCYKSRGKWLNKKGEKI